MSVRASSANGTAGQPATRFADRRQERMRGGGKYEINKRTFTFKKESSIQRLASSSSSSAAYLASSTPLRQEEASTLFMKKNIAGRGEGDMSSTPAMSIRSGRASLVASSSPSKYIDPRLLADQSHNHHKQQQPQKQQHTPLMPNLSSAHRGESLINQRRQERMRGAGTHQIEPRLIQFNQARLSDVPSSTSRSRSSSIVSTAESSKGALDRFMQSISSKALLPSDAYDDTSNMEKEENLFLHHHDHPPPHHISKNGKANGKPNWIEQRKMERRRGAGAYQIEQRKVNFGRPSDQDVSSSVPNSESVQEEEEEEEEAVDKSLGIMPLQSTPKRVQQTSANFFDDNDLNYGHDSEEGLEMKLGPQMDFEQDNQSINDVQSPGSIAAHKAMEKRKTKRQGSPLRNIPRKTKARNVATAHRGINLDALQEGDETVLGQADVTLLEQREAAFTAPDPPNWILSRKPVSLEELTFIKDQVKEMVTLALGNEAGASRAEKVNDADVLWSVLEHELLLSTKTLNRRNQNYDSTILDTIQHLTKLLLYRFTHLSQQSAERSKLIHHLNQARRRNLQIRKEVFKKRSQVLEVKRTLKMLERQEVNRKQMERQEQQSINFLLKLKQASKEWC